jgi:hypothetical protein
MSSNKQRLRNGSLVLLAQGCEISHFQFTSSQWRNLLVI